MVDFTHADFTTQIWRRQMNVRTFLLKVQDQVIIQVCFFIIQSLLFTFLVDQ
jgi:hypothetical protein